MSLKVPSVTTKVDVSCMICLEFHEYEIELPIDREHFRLTLKCLHLPEATFNAVILAPFDNRPIEVIPIVMG